MPRTRRYPGSIRRKGNRWEIRLTVGGQRHEFTVEGTEAAAKKAASEKHAELERRRQRRVAGLPGEITFSELLAKFRASESTELSDGGSKSYEDTFKVLDRYFVDAEYEHGLADPAVHTVRRGHIKEFLAWRRGHRFDGRRAKVSLHTVARDRRVLHRLFNYALDIEVVEANPVARVKTKKPDPRTPVILDGEQFEKLIDACGDPMLRLAVLFLAETGARSVSEALRLQWDNVDLARGFVFLQSQPAARTKAGKSRWTPLSPRLRTALRDHAAEYRMKVYDGHRSPFVFHHAKSHRKIKAGTPVRGIYHAVVRAARSVGIPRDFRPHDLRHRRVTTWLAEGRSAVLVKEAVGHSALATTMGYTHLVPEHLQALFDADDLQARKEGTTDE